jgi:hydrogenase nickel incorporation protein HypB
MCAVCGCGEADGGPAHVHTRADGSTYAHAHDRTHGDAHAPHADYGGGLAGVHVPGMSEARIVQVERDILSKNDAYAAENRKFFEENGIFALNLVSSPGSGKTSLLVLAINHLLGRLPIFVIEGDQQTSNDAERIRATGAPALQINTGKGCHLDAHMIAHAVETLGPVPGSALFIENVGNLVCPAAFDLGEAHKVVVFSVTEGEDKPLKYPDMFAAADLMLLNKSDLLPHLDFDVSTCIANALRVNPRLQTLLVSARTGEGMAAFYAWIEASAARGDQRAGARS